MLFAVRGRSSGVGELRPQLRAGQGYGTGSGRAHVHVGLRRKRRRGRVSGQSAPVSLYKLQKNAPLF